MKLIKPTDDELNACFAEKVAGWTYWKSKHGHWHVTSPSGHVTVGDLYAKFDEETGEKLPEVPWWKDAELPDFTQSAAAVLPWLEKHVAKIAHRCSQWEVLIHMGWSGNEQMPFAKSNDFEYWDRSFPRACVIALLRAHGVGVEL